jgi:hypothetical protein
MTTVQRFAVVVGFVGCLVSIASFAQLAHLDSSKSRVAFDNNGYPANISVQLWLDDAIEGRLMRATCTIDHCETEPTLIDRGRHQMRLRVLIGDQASAFTVTTIRR